MSLKSIRSCHKLIIRSFNTKYVKSKVAGSSEIPEPRGLPLIGTTLSLLAVGGPSKLHEYVEKRHRELGPIFRDNIGPVKAVFVADPDWVKQIFIQKEGKHPKHIYPGCWALYNEIKQCQRGIFFMDGEEWYKYRQILNKILLRGKPFEWMKVPVEQVAKTSVVNWASKSAGRKIDNLENHLYRWSLDSVTAILLGGQVKKMSIGTRVESLLQELTFILQDVFDTTSDLSLLPPKLAWQLKLPIWRRFENAMDRTIQVGQDLTSELLKHCHSGGGLLEKILAEGVSDDVTARLVTDLLLAAGDTTAHTMEWTLYLLGRNPKVQAEIRNALTETPSAEFLESVRDYPSALQGCILESMRLYPVAPFLNRIMTADVTICDYPISAGTLIVMSAYTMGRDERWFSDPKRFWPSRWDRISEATGTTRRAALPGASIPFALGARSCIGQTIALAQLHTTLAELLKNYSVKLENEKEVDIKLRLITAPSEPINISLHKQLNTKKTKID